MKLPKCYYAVVTSVIQHLHRISAESEINNMSPYNLAVIFGPTLLHCLRGNSNTTSRAALFDNVHQIRAIELMITWADELFLEWSVAKVLSIWVGHVWKSLNVINRVTIIKSFYENFLLMPAFNICNDFLHVNKIDNTLNDYFCGAPRSGSSILERTWKKSFNTTTTNANWLGRKIIIYA